MVVGGYGYPKVVVVGGGGGGVGHHSLLVPPTDKAPATHSAGYRAHPSLPQPLHLRATFVDHKTRTSAVEFEQVITFNNYCSNRVD